MTYEYEYPRPSVTVDCVLFGFDLERATLDILLIQRKDPPFKDSWALPGGFVEVGKDETSRGESLEDAAKRELEEETGAKVDYLEQLHTFGTPNRDPRGRVISVAYFAMVKTKDHVVAGNSDAKDARWFPITVAMEMNLAFDHNQILKMAVTRVQSKIRYAPIGFNLLPNKFTMAELQQLYEGLLLRELDRSNFRRKMTSAGVLIQVGERARSRTTVQTYKFDKTAYNEASSAGFSFEPRYVKGK